MYEEQRNNENKLEQTTASQSSCECECTLCFILRYCQHSLCLASVLEKFIASLGGFGGMGFSFIISSMK